MKSLPRIIYYLLFTGIALNAIKLYFAQTEMAKVASEGVYPWYYKMSFFANILISIGTIASFVKYRKYFPKFVTVCYLLLLLFIIIATGNDISEVLDKPNFFYTSKGIGTFLNIGILFFAADSYYFPKLLKLFYYICFGLIIAGFVNLGNVGFGAGRKEYLQAIRDFTVYLIWVFPFFFLQDEPDKKKNLLNLFVFLIIFIFILSSGSRSYLIIYFLYAAVKFKTKLQSKSGLIAIIGIVILVVGGYLVIANSSLNKTLEGAINNLAERSGEDTRSEQIVDFMSQYDMDYLVQGVGPLKLWNWHGVGLYGYLDNQVLLIAWWAGLPAVITYMLFLLMSLFVKTEILLFETIKGTKLIIGLWIAATLGFAIYITVSTELSYYFISVMMGLNACQYSKILEPGNEHIK